MNRAKMIEDQMRPDPGAIRDGHSGEPESADADPRFTNRMRIALYEPDPVLQRLFIRTLLSQGCVVSRKRDLDQLQIALRDGPLDGALIDLSLDLLPLEALDDANALHVPLVVLLDMPAEPHLCAQFPTLRFLQKPPDIGALLEVLRLSARSIT